MNFVDELERLERLRQNASLTDAEFEQAKTKLLSAATSSNNDEATQVSSLKKELELARLDQAWQQEKEGCMIDMRFGRRLPNDFAGWIGICIGVGLGAYLIWVWAKNGSTDGTPVTAISLIFSIPLIFIFLWSGSDERKKAAKYVSRERTYRRQREQISRSS